MRDTLAKGCSGRWPSWDITPRERTCAMGDKGGKKDKNKSQKQKQSKKDKQAKKKLDKKQAKRPV